MVSRTYGRFGALMLLLASTFFLLTSPDIGVTNAAKQKAKDKEKVAAAHPLEKDGRCLSCHQDAMEHIWKSPHADVLLLKNKSKGGEFCKACHGDFADHLEDTYNPDFPLRFSKGSSASVKEKNQPCLSCHNDSPHLSGWLSGQHETAMVGCVDCHSVHQPEKGTKSLAAVQTKVCSSCHVKVAHEIKLPSHMPIGEGVECSDCHQVHGSMNAAAMKDPFPSQTCTSCHMEYRGPFLNSHPPVEENCMNCHTPHGSATEPLLKAQLPFLCLECHSQMSSQHGLSTASGELDPSGLNNNLYTAGKACLNCHSQIHGSNHAGGARLQR